MSASFQGCNHIYISMFQRAKQTVNQSRAVFFVDSSGEWNAHRTSLDAILINLIAQERIALQKSAAAVQELIDVPGI
jgi:hypothetical protein